MTIKNRGGVFGRNPTFNDVDVDGTLSIGGSSIPAPANTATYDASPAAFENTITANGLTIGSSTQSNTVAEIKSANNTTAGLDMFGDLGAAKGFRVKYEGNGNYFAIEDNTSAVLTERLRIDGTGHVKVTTGNLIIGTSGQGIDFSATAGTGTSELFDDYEEGTWTPAYSTSGGSFTYDSATQGQYTKIGNVVTVYFRIYTNSATVGTGDVSITGLPFAEAIPSGLGGGSIGDCRLFAGDTPDTLTVAGSAIYPYYRTSANGANTPLQASDLDTGGAVKNLIDGQITYITS